ncbi:hypothetical protein EDD58_101624 [Hazenella coriacea]|uniref:Uncharacterized protein n=1 Tax=Hazenella coriacea TaxID=1179467 RepID=A0A4V6NZB3_9BACL|nr:hypothetical protein EDD58_101624 [Hazenella coriacea]
MASSHTACKFYFTLYNEPIDEKVYYILKIKSLLLRTGFDLLI